METCHTPSGILYATNTIKALIIFTSQFYSNYSNESIFMNCPTATINKNNLMHKISIKIINQLLTSNPHTFYMECHWVFHLVKLMSAVASLCQDS